MRTKITLRVLFWDTWRVISGYEHDHPYAIPIPRLTLGSRSGTGGGSFWASTRLTPRELKWYSDRPTPGSKKGKRVSLARYTGLKEGRTQKQIPKVGDGFDFCA